MADQLNAPFMDLDRVIALDTAMWGRARQHAMGRKQIAVVDGTEPWSILGEESAANLMQRWTHAGILFKRWTDKSQPNPRRRERIVFGDVPDAPQIVVGDDGITLGTARRARMRYVAEREGIDRDERIEVVRGLPDAARILSVCDPLAMAVHTRDSDEARAHVAVLRKNVDDYYADRTGIDAFRAIQGQTWGMINAERLGVRAMVKFLIRTVPFAEQRPEERAHDLAENDAMFAGANGAP